MLPGGNFIDIIPALGWIPAWVPGAQGVRAAAYIRQRTEEMKRIPMDFVKKQFVSGSKTRNAQAPLHPKAYLTRIRDRPFLRWSRICWNGNLLKAFPLRRNKLSKILLTQSSVVRDGKSLVNGSCNFTRLVAASDTVRSFFLAIFPTNLSSFPLDNCSDQGIFLFHGKASRCSKESARGNRSSCLVQTSPRLQRPQLRKDALY